MKRHLFKALISVIILSLIIGGYGCSPAKIIEQAVDPRDYITTNDPAVQTILPEIIAHKAFWRTDFGGIQVWVDNHITYVRDTDDYWQRPAETLARRQGDCEDFAILLCTLLRAYGIPAEDVYVAIGVDDYGNAHAFLLERWYYGEWRVIEPQYGGLFTTDLAAWDTGQRFTPNSVFNDVEYEGKPYWLSQLFKQAIPPSPTPVQEALSVYFEGWYIGDSKVTTATMGNTVIARISLTGGDSGQYTLRIRRDIRGAADETIDELNFNYDGVSATKELSFSPPYATDEASTDGYHIDLMKDGYTAWDMINAYPPRLRVSAPTVGPLSVTFSGWYVEGHEVTTASKDDTVIARISLTGGDSGQYTLRIRRDIVWASDETVNELLFSYDGVTDTLALSFAPAYATGEGSTDGYHIDLVKGGYIVWTLANAYPPRLRVTF